MEKLHVQAPSEVVFLCGGPWSDEHDEPILSMRDAFMRIAEHQALRGRELVLAENVTRLSAFTAYYDELLGFENDLAQIVELILLFCESEGSFAELGSFVMLGEIASRVLVIVRDHHWKDDSFIKLGPLQYLINNQDEYSVFVIEDAVMGMQSANVAEIKLQEFQTAIDEPLKTRLNRRREPSTFDHEKSGHVIKLVVGLTQEYGALTLKEIRDALSALGIDKEEREVGAYVLCAEAVGWLTKKSKGFNEYVVATGGEDAALFHAPENAEITDRKRRRLLIREHWSKNEPARLRAISEEVGGDL
ncbi:MAG: retron St85 family effector protein [Pseudomonadota bacterium]